MNLIPNAIVYQADLPAIDLVAEHLASIPFEPLGKTFRSRAGFIPNAATAELVTPIEGGFSFTVRLDEKILPATAVRRAIHEALEAFAEEREMTINDLDEQDIGEQTELTMSNLIANALIKTTVVNCFYSVEHNYLLIATTSKPLAQTAIALLIKAIGSVKTSTIHVDDVKGGLTTRLKNFVQNQDEKAFDGFTLGTTCNMKHQSDKVNFSMDKLEEARAGLNEALEAEFKVELMELVHETVAFKLTSDFKLRGIHYFADLTEDEMSQRDEADAAFLWRLVAATQLLQVVATITALCDLFSYQKPELVETIPAKKALDAVPELEGEDDPLYSDAVEFVRESKRASISAVQRKLKIGYNRAARMIERMELDGIITPMDFHGGREVKPEQI